ncbi:MAG: hypothetical protein ACP5D2_01010 [Candidatus Nanoarchaeia archaeon]
MLGNNFNRDDCGDSEGWCEGADINQDGVVDDTDLSFLNDSWGAKGDINYEMDADIDNDGEIGPADFNLLNDYYGCEYGEIGPAPEDNLTFYCKESDDGEDYFVKGICKDNAHGYERTFEDYCGLDVNGFYNENILTEFFCEDGKTSSVSYECKSGCEDGRCLNSTKQDKCSLLDIGIKKRVEEIGVENVTLIEGEEIGEGDYFLVPFYGGHILELDSIDNGTGAYNDSIRIRDIETDNFYNVNMISEGRGRLIIDGEEIKVDYEEGSVSFSWYPYDIIDTFYCDLSCNGLVEDIKEPVDVIYGSYGVEYKLSYNDSYMMDIWVKGQQIDVKKYVANWYRYSGEGGQDISYSVFVFNNSDYPIIYLENRMNWEICTSNIIYAGNESEVVYLCSYYDEEQSSSTYNRVYWVNNNYLFEFTSGQWQSLDDDTRLNIKLDNFIEKLKDNRYRWANPYLNYGFENILENELSRCGSELEPFTDDRGEECSPCWECKLEPIICPPHGRQKEVCVDNCCDQTKESTRVCSPGICSGCYMPQWMGSSVEKCIPYGSRLTKQAIDEDDNIELEEGNFSDYLLDIVSDEQAEFVLKYDKRNIRYTLVEGETTYIYPLDFGEEQYFMQLDVIEVNDEEGYVLFNVLVAEEFNAYCSLDGEFRRQKRDWSRCQNSYECESNLCSGGECVAINAMIQEASGIKVLGVRVLCRLADLLGIEDSYEGCLAEYLGDERSSGQLGEVEVSS